MTCPHTWDADVSHEHVEEPWMIEQSGQLCRHHECERAEVHGKPHWCECGDEDDNPWLSDDDVAEAMRTLQAGATLGAVAKHFKVQRETIVRRTGTRGQFENGVLRSADL